MKKRNILQNAQIHSGGNVLLKLDFRSFFPSIKVGSWKKFLESDDSQILSLGDFPVSSRILFWGDGSRVPKCLSIGAPTSPTLSNILLFNFDTRVAEMAKVHGVSYTRYADDITISACSRDDVYEFEKILISEIKRMKSPRLQFNGAKRGVYSKGQRQMVTGLVLTPDGNVSIGRDRKRMISSLLHRHSLGQLDLEKKGLLKGFLAFSIANEPSFVNRMRVKYGDRLVSDILTMYLPRLNEGK